MKNWLSALMTVVVLAMLVGFAWAVTSPAIVEAPYASRGDSAGDDDPYGFLDDGPYHDYTEQEEPDEDDPYGFL